MPNKSVNDNNKILLFLGMTSMILVFQLDDGFLFFNETNPLSIFLSITLALISIVCNVTYLKRINQNSKME
ncbi:MAG: hypothetical protein ACW964_00345 [Candidatus Hodarchaeales archaeon]|jgi:hypothetical protein